MNRVKILVDPASVGIMKEFNLSGVIVTTCPDEELPFAFMTSVCYEIYCLNDELLFMAAHNITLMGVHGPGPEHMVMTLERAKLQAKKNDI